MFIILNKLEDAFIHSGAKKCALKKYKQLEMLHQELVCKVHQLKQYNSEALIGKTHDAVEERIKCYEKKLATITCKLEEVRQSIGGGH